MQRHVDNELTAKLENQRNEILICLEIFDIVSFEPRPAHLLFISQVTLATTPGCFIPFQRKSEALIVLPSFSSRTPPSAPTEANFKCENRNDACGGGRRIDPIIGCDVVSYCKRIIKISPDAPRHACALLRTAPDSTTTTSFVQPPARICDCDTHSSCIHKRTSPTASSASRVRFKTSKKAGLYSF